MSPISIVYTSSPREIFLCPGILDPAYSDELILLVGNLINSPLAVNYNLLIAYVHLLAVDDIFGYVLCGLMRDLGLPDPSISFVMPSLNANLLAPDYAEALALLNKYGDLFTTSPHDFGLLRGASHHLNLENKCPFLSQPYCKSKAEEAQVAFKLN